MESVYKNIRQNFDILSKAEKRVAKYCIDNYTTIGMYSLSQLAKNSKSGEATIVRFCNKLGYSSFKHFKTELINDINKESLSQEDPIVSNIKMSTINSLDYISKNINPSKLNLISRELYEADKILCIGVGNSSIAAEACAMRLIRNGKNAIFFKDPHFQTIYINELKKKDVAILFSVSGESKDVIHCANLISNKNITIISITSSDLSTVAQKSKYHILIKGYNRNHINGGSMTGQISQMLIADILTTKVAMINVENATKARKITYDYILDKMNKN